jgi:hypothetical protein
MLRSLAHRIYNLALMVALCAIFVIAGLLLNQERFETVSQAAEISSSSGSYGELPPVW